MDHTHMTVKIDLAALESGLQRSLQRIIDVVSFGLTAADTADDKEPIRPLSFFRFTPADNTQMDFSEAKDACRKWTLTNGIRDAIEAVNSFLEHVRPICFVYSHVSDAGLTMMGEEWNAGMTSDSKKFHRLGLPGKIKFIATRYDASLQSELSGDILSINNARNCLVHRGGVAAIPDKNCTEGLRVEWKRLEVFADGPTGERAVSAGHVIPAGDRVGLRWMAQSRVFGIGDAVSFSDEEFVELCLTTLMFGKELVNSLRDYGETKGIGLNTPDGNEASPE